MLIGRRLHDLREQKKLSQADVERLSGLRRTYISRVENGHVLPSVETLRKLAVVLGVPLYQVFYNQREPPKRSSPSRSKKSGRQRFETQNKDVRYVIEMHRLIARLDSADLRLLLHIARKMAHRSQRR